MRIRNTNPVKQNIRGNWHVTVSMETSFVRKPNSDVWKQVLSVYDTVLRAKSAKMKDSKASDLLKLDQWYQNDLSTAIQKRGDKHISQEEIIKLMKWKLTRGKFRPRLQQMVESNSAEDVLSASKKAFKAGSDVSKAVNALTVLKAIGPATASAVLAAGNPEKFPFMADESMLALGIQPLQYTLPAYVSYTQQVRGICDQLKEQDKDFEWTCHKVELALWTYHVGKLLVPEDVEKCVSAKSDKRSSDTDIGDGESIKKKKKKDV